MLCLGVIGVIEGSVVYICNYAVVGKRKEKNMHWWRVGSLGDWVEWVVYKCLRGSDARADEKGKEREAEAKGVMEEAFLWMSERPMGAWEEEGVKR